MCQVRAHLHQPCGCKSHQLRICRSSKTTQPELQGQDQRGGLTTTTTTTMATVNGNITSINRSNSSSGNNNPRFITICSATFDPATLAACPSYNVHPEVVDAHPCSDHWTMLADARLFFGLPGALESVQSDEEGVGGMNGYDSLLKDRLDVLRERFCWKGDGNGRAGSGSDVNGDVNGVSIDDQSQSRDQSQNQSRSETRRRVPRKPPPAMTEAKGGRTFIDILCDWMGGFRDGI